METSLAIAIIGLLLAWLAVFLARLQLQTANRDNKVEQFRNVRRHLKTQAAAVVDAVAPRDGPMGSTRWCAEDGVPLLTQPGWVPPEPLTIGALRLSLRPLGGTESLDSARNKLRRNWPGMHGAPVTSYSQAIQVLDRPSLWFNGPSYRLLKVHDTPGDSNRGGLDLEFSMARYFDAVDTTEALGYEAARDHLQAQRFTRGGRYRRWLSDPFDFSRRCAVPGVSTLTLKVGGDSAYFFMHLRSGADVAVSMGTTHVAPAGEFQPQGDVLTAWERDLDVWHNIMREYAEEFLGVPDAAGHGGALIDYVNDEPYVGMNLAARNGQVRTYFLGMGLDPLTWKPEICTVCAWDAATFDDIFHSVADRNEEGVLVVGTRRNGRNEGLPFDAETVRGYLTDASTDSVSKACLSLAWQWRSKLGLPGTGAQRPRPTPSAASDIGVSASSSVVSRK